MIQVRLNKQENRITQLDVSGHAYSGEPGHDLVCAAVSSITTGTLNALNELANDFYELKLIDGTSPLVSISEKVENETGRVVLETTYIQLKTIQETYPEYIDIQIGR